MKLRLAVSESHVQSKMTPPKKKIHNNRGDFHHQMQSCKPAKIIKSVTIIMFIIAAREAEVVNLSFVFEPIK